MELLETEQKSIKYPMKIPVESSLIHLFGITLWKPEPVGLKGLN